MNIPVEIASVGDSIVLPIQDQPVRAVITEITPSGRSYELKAECMGQEVSISIQRGHTLDLVC